MFALLATVAHAQDPKIIEVPLPPEDPGSVEATEAATPEVLVPVPDPNANRGGRVPRREARKVQGQPPTALYGTWSVVQVSELGETEDYRIKMERAGKAMDQDCLTTAMQYDFGPPPTVPGFPSQVTVTEVQECTKGGLGAYASETSITTAVTWTTEGGLSLQMSEARGTTALLRLRMSEDPGRTPSQWVGPETRFDRPQSKFSVLAEYPRQREGTGAPTALHLTGTNGAVLHLEPVGGGERRDRPSSGG